MLSSFTNFEYLLFNIVVFSGPIFFGSMKKYYFWTNVPAIIKAVLIPAVPFILWDIIVADYHWYFNYNYVSGIYLAGLPVEEWLFFLTVPFACLYTWEMVIKRNKLSFLKFSKFLKYTFILFLLTGFIFLTTGLYYTGLAFISLAVIGLFDLLYGPAVVTQSRFYLFAFFLTMFILIFNGYLTARPVVLYGQEYQIGYRIFTIPIEDFIYGYALVIFNITLYERFKIRGRDQS